MIDSSCIVAMATGTGGRHHGQAQRSMQTQHRFRARRTNGTANASDTNETGYSPMSVKPALESISERLKQAQEETCVAVTIEGRPRLDEMHETSPPNSPWEGKRSVDRYLDKGDWKTKGPGFQRLLEWVEVHWNPERELQVPSGSAITQETWGSDGEAQLDAATAARKLIAAARLHGCDGVVKCAVEFATHGLIEVNRIYLLKGPAVETAIRLDEFCVILPYREARRKIDTESDPEETSIFWPDPDAGNICALDCRYFERRTLPGMDFLQYSSPLLTDGPERLALLLGLVSLAAFRVFGGSHGVPAVAQAALPFRHAAAGRGAGNSNVSLALTGYGPQLGHRPLPVAELRLVDAKFRALPRPLHSKVERTMQRLRCSAERTDRDDRAIDLGIALHVLFMEGSERKEPPALIPQRAAWLYADSDEERRRTEDMLGRFYSHYSDLVRGHVSREKGAEGDGITTVLADTDNVLRACLKNVIVEGLPKGWTRAADHTRLRLHPPRTASEIPSVKADSLSWSVAEQEEIDSALAAIWKPVVEEAPRPDGSASTVGQHSPELVERFREQGTPFVVLHPARLYMAHPKWPRTASEPLDDRARHYCERDVKRHVRDWAKAATTKGLVQLHLPTDAELYRPDRADDWPLPLFSSHEEEADRRAPDRSTTEEPAMHEAEASAAATDRQRSDATENSGQPPQQLPASTVSDLEREWSRLWSAFQHDVNVATNSLLHMLDGIHATHHAEGQRLSEALGKSDRPATLPEDAVRGLGDISVPTTYPSLRGFPQLTGEPLITRSAPRGPMEQTAFKGWLSDVYDRWESHYRTQLKHATSVLPGAIRPRQPVLGDLRHIRNNLLHSGIARKGEAADCEILKWFAKGERMLLGIGHVLDFLNQMAWLDESPVTGQERAVQFSRWHIAREGAVEDPAPALISVRPLLYPEEELPQNRYVASIAYENGVFGLIPMGSRQEETEAQAKERSRKWLRMQVSDQGDLNVPELGTAPAADLYQNCLKGESRRGPGIWKPWVQFRQ